MQIDVSKIFYRYFEEQQNNSYRKASGPTFLDDYEFKAKFGESPWDEVNNLLKKYGFRHSFIAPNKAEDPRATNGYKAKLIDENNNIIEISDLSSGETVIIALLLSTYAAQQKTNRIFQIDIPDVILFDELDAHLHPSMTRMMFDVIQSSLIERLSTNVIMSTHSPSTIALAPSASVFKLTPGLVHKLRPVDKATACRDLSDGFVQILDGSQIVIVEGKDDPLFYRAIERAIRTSGDLIGVPVLHFVPASKSSDPSSGGGVKTAEDWAIKLKETNLPNIHALLDNDGIRENSGSIKVLQGRYAIENFVLDPIAIAITLITDGRLVNINTVVASNFPQVSSIALASVIDLQNLINKICAFIEVHDTSLLSSNTVKVSYSFNKELILPEWIIKKRGKDLVRPIREAFQTLDKRYIITRKDFGDFDLDLGYLLKLWSQHPNLFPVELKQTLLSLRSN